MKTKMLVRIGFLPLLALLIFACKKEAQTTTSSDLLISESGSQKVTPQQGPEENWSVDIVVTKNACNEQVFTLTGMNKEGKAIKDGDGMIELTISNSNGIVGTPSTGSSPLIVTTHLAPGSYSLTANISTGNKLRGQSLPLSVVVNPCADCPYKSLEELTCADLQEGIEIGDKLYKPEELCQLLTYNRGNKGEGALLRLAQAIMVAKWNGFASHPAVAAADALMVGYDALNLENQGDVVDQYGAPEKGRVQDLTKCAE